MSKLFNLKEWLTVADAARHLAIVFGEDVAEADVLRLGLDGRLRLSVHFVNHARARCGKVVSWAETEWMIVPPLKPRKFAVVDREEETAASLEAPRHLTQLVDALDEQDKVKFMSGELYPFMKSLSIDGKRFLNLSDEVTTLRGVWDLCMVGNEVPDIEHQYQIMTGGPSVTLQGLDGAFVEREDGEMFQLMESFEKSDEADAEFLEFMEDLTGDARTMAGMNALVTRDKERRKSVPKSEKYYPASGLPEDGVIVVRTKSLREFEQSLTSVRVEPEKPMTSTERDSLLTIIAALCDYSAIDPHARGAASQIAKFTEEFGAPVSDDTVRRALAKMRDALEARMK